MIKPRTTTLEALRALISERQQYDQWISALQAKRSGSSEHVFNRVYADYRSRLERVVEQIRSHAEELQVSITQVSDKLQEVAGDEEAKRDSLQEAELRAAVGEYDETQWESMRTDANLELEKIAANRSGLEAQLSELESIRKLSEVTAPSAEAPEVIAPSIAGARSGSAGGTAEAAVPETVPPSAKSGTQETIAPETAANVNSEGSSTGARLDQQAPERRPSPDAGWPQREVAAADAFAPTAAASASAPAAGTSASSPAAAPRKSTPTVAQPLVSSTDPAVAAPRPSATPVAPPPAPAPPPRKRRDTPVGKDSQISSGFSRPVQTPADGRPEVNKTLKCPECGTPNYPTEWYCERCGGELATM